LKNYFGQRYTSIEDILIFKNILEEKINPVYDYESDMFAWFYALFEGTVLDKYFSKSWKALWDYANHHGIYEQKNLKKDRYALMALRKLILDITKKPNKNLPITYKDTEYLIYYAACFPSLDCKYIDAANEYFRCFNIYYRNQLHKSPEELTMLDKIEFSKNLVEDRTRENKMIIIRRVIL